MKIDKSTGKIQGIHNITSPNCDDRPNSDNISLIVIHGISIPPGRFGGDYIEQLFTNNLSITEHPYFQEIINLRVSAHLLINREGVLTQFVPFNKRAWHAGESKYKGCESCNDFSIGIELEGVDDIPYTEEQYTQLAEVLQHLYDSYPLLSRDTMTSHSDIAPGRKTDPGQAFDWEYLNLKLDIQYKLSMS
ncbi:MAG: 1,6-anhydro-N-acetylmuramyl-L-alanine amidase AmpD [Thiohalomonadales bacterium]